jgi:hypothetical protein
MITEEGIPRDVWENRVHSKAWRNMKDWLKANVALKTQEIDKMATDFSKDVKDKWITQYFS